MSNSGAGRLPTGVRPRSYHIDLTVLPAQRRFFGAVTIDLTLESATDTVTLHALDLKIDHILIGSIEGNGTFDPSSETLKLSFPEKIASGETKLSLRFSGILNQEMRGLYEVTVDGETYAFTQFEATDARRMFPCFDEPGMKARFHMNVNVPANLVALSNMPIIQERVQGEMKTVVFETSPQMSTYLLALGVARLEKREIDIDGTAVALWAHPEQLGLSTFALKVAAAVLPLLNDYFDHPCPTPKLDLVSVPDFAMGAMENWGAIFFRDSRLLLDEKFASTRTQREVANVITHEIVHQWFGNLVTMIWWDDLWLNESFATWLACKIVDRWRPEWHSWVSFQEEKEAPLNLDALENTRAIQADVTSPDQIEEMFDVLTYEKGASCLRMIEQFVGEENFREAIRNYMKRYQYKNAPADALWTELEKVSKQPISAIAKDWFTRPGFPIVQIDSIGNDFKELSLSQKRFSAFKAEPPGESRPWLLPFSIKYKDTEGIKTFRALLKEETSQLSLPANGAVQWVYGNAGESGFLRTHHGASLRQALQKVVTTDIEPTERIGFLAHLWALSRKGDLPLSSFMETLCLFQGDESRAVVTAICAYFECLSNQLASRDDRPRFALFVTQFFNPIWKTISWDPEPDEDDDRRLTRADLLWTLGAVGRHDDILAELPRRQARYIFRPDSLDPTLVTPLIRLCARSDGGTRFDQFINKFKKSTTPEERDRYLIALADFTKPALAQKVLAFALSDAVRQQDLWKPVRALLSNPKVQGETWVFIKKNWVAFRKKGGSIGAQRIIQAARFLWSSHWHEEIRSFYNQPENQVPSAERSLAQTLEFIQLGIQFKELQMVDFSDWLHKSVP